MNTPIHSPWREAFSMLYGTILGASRMARNSTRLLREIGGRSGGSPAGEAAQSFVQEVLEEAGLDEIELEPFPVQGWERGGLRLEWKSPRAGPIPALSLGQSCGTPPGGVEGCVVDLGYGGRGDFDNIGPEARGCWVLAEEGGPKGEQAPHRSVKMELARQAGALGLLLMSGQEGGLPKTGTCRITGISGIPGVGIPREDGMAMRSLLASGQPVACRLAMENRAFDAKVTNILGVLRGREKPEEIVALGGHLDSWDVSEGAMDNGSGVLVLLEAARALGLLPARPRRSVVFGFFMAEEIGLCGSLHHVKAHQNRLDDVVSYLNLDIVSEPVQLMAGGKEASFPLLQRIAEALEPLGVGREVGFSLGLHSDHVPFMVEGVPTLHWRCRFEEGTTQYCHSAADTSDKNDLKGLHLCACATSALVFALAEEPGRPVARLPRETTRRMLEEAGLRADLEAEGAWPFQERT